MSKVDDKNSLFFPFTSGRVGSFVSTTERNVDFLLSVRKTEFYSIKMYAFAFLHIGEYVKIQILCLKAQIVYFRLSAVPAYCLIR